MAKLTAFEKREKVRQVLLRYLLAVDNKHLDGELGGVFNDLLFNNDLREEDMDHVKKHGIPVKPVRGTDGYFWVVDYSKI